MGNLEASQPPGSGSRPELGREGEIIVGRCSAHAPGEVIVGTAPVEKAYLILELAKPWARKIKAEGAIAAFKPLLKGGVAKDVKMLATPRIDWLPLCQRPWALLVRWSRGQALVQELDATPETISRALQQPAAGEPMPLYLVCTHGSRDRCCGTLGYPIYRQLLENSARRTLQVSHLGGHRYAPVVLALPEWRFFGHVSPESCPSLDLTLDRGEPYLDGYRGHGRLPALVQPVEAELWAQFGSQLARVRPLRIEGQKVTVEARMQDDSRRTFQARLGVQEIRGYKSCSDVDEGKKPKTFELPKLLKLEEVASTSQVH